MHYVLTEQCIFMAELSINYFQEQKMMGGQFQKIFQHFATNLDASLRRSILGSNKVMNVGNYLTHFLSYTFATDKLERALCKDFPCLKLKEEALLLRLIVVSSLVSKVEQPFAKARTEGPEVLVLYKVE